MDDSDQIHRTPKRDIIESFAHEISENKETGAKPETAVIPFRQDREHNKVRPVYFVPTELLRFRKENGRIASDVESYQRFRGPLDEEKESDQEKLRKFLEDKDPEKTEDLIRSLDHEGQLEPAVITADGFLINGNRRKMALEKLFEKSKDPKFLHMRVVILPGQGEESEGGAPTNVEIELLENAYQFHHDGKSEYYKFDRALSIRRKERLGISLEMQLRRDSRYAKLDERKFNAEVKKYRNEYLGPLECIDEYLEHIGRPGDYSSISGGKSDPEGRWQAFLDYYKSVDSKLKDTRSRIAMDVEDFEVGAIQDAAFKILRQRTFGKSNEFVPNKTNDIMRQLPNILKNTQAKNELLKLKKLPEGNGEEDSEWVTENHKEVSHHVTEAFRLVRNKSEGEEPLARLERALQILQSEDIDPERVPIASLPSGLKLINSLKERTEELKDKFWLAQKNSHDSLEQLQHRSH